MNKKKGIRPKSIWWAMKIHSSSAISSETSRSNKTGHVSLNVEAKERLVVIIKERLKREGQKHFFAAYLTKKPLYAKAQRKDSDFECPLAGFEGSFVETPSGEI